MGGEGMGRDCMGRYGCPIPPYHRISSHPRHPWILRSWMLDPMCLVSRIRGSMAMGSQNPRTPYLCLMMLMLKAQCAGTQDCEVRNCEIPSS